MWAWAWVSFSRLCKKGCSFCWQAVVFGVLLTATSVIIVSRPFQDVLVLLYIPRFLFLQGTSCLKDQRRQAKVYGRYHVARRLPQGQRFFGLIHAPSCQPQRRLAAAAAAAAATAVTSRALPEGRREAYAPSRKLEKAGALWYDTHLVLPSEGGSTSVQ